MEFLQDSQKVLFEKKKKKRKDISYAVTKRFFLAIVKFAKNNVFAPKVLSPSVVAFFFLLFLFHGSSFLVFFFVK